ncbi:MAG: hypothetical protein KUA43_06330 [Hoeflea sp.]|uniref:hypothetical protein n=1 Tax=Hoeflea sp. TaxID=1940281 RepID=UPI001D31B066|nr:hypothetical protein [Hoeflea sp.]MBU4530175.1 hypothetical protein [Alphaproteobacteria bacterium]MBU4542540.1 hypothetical protein [Alphaproteobacteria bacterium]MBU4551221.1 hypothetical protein [Alphaproteobacteria bacterium]MBV1723044.1 hypothetical protein [Hoeflea sp.]MBV1760055.1 hypothetical protein [Hoeflea sp.]
MATILTFDVSRRRQVSAPVSRGMSDTAQVLIFTGVRREPLLPTKHTHRHHEPMFHDPLDPAPDKPSGKKRRRGKAG